MFTVTKPCQCDSASLAQWREKGAWHPIDAAPERAIAGSLAPTGAQDFCICRGWPAGDSWRAAIPVDWHQSPAGWLLQLPRFFVFVGAGLPAIRGVRQFPLTGIYRQQAGSYRGSGFLYLWELACRRMFACGSTCSPPRFASRLAPYKGQGEQAVYRQRMFDFVGAGLPANVHLRQYPLIATIRQQAGSYKGQGEQAVHRQRVFVFVGDGLPANVRLRQYPLIATIRQQAGSYRDKKSKPLTASGRLTLWELACKRFVQLMQCSLAPKIAGRPAPTKKQHLSRGANCGSKPEECQSASAVTT